MNPSQYILTADEMIISDPELELELCLPFSLPRLPDGLNGKGIIHEKNREGASKVVYCVHEGRRHGECRYFSEEGKVSSEMFYYHGKLHGPSIMYGEKGEVLSRTWYCEGKRIGKAYFYFPNGAISSVQRYKNGEWEGVQEYFYLSGVVKSLIPFNGGKIHGEVRLFWESGTPKRLVPYKHGLREGMDQLWNEKGVLIDAGEYGRGQPKGIHRHYFADGKIKEERSYHTPFRFDRKEWDATGRCLYEGVFAPDLTYTEKVYTQPQGVKIRKGVWDGNCIRWK